MKLKFIFNMTARAAAPAFAAWLLIVLTAGIPLRAQQPDAPATAKVDSPPKAETDEADPPSEETVETMFPHFKNTRYWLSGQ